MATLKELEPELWSELEFGALRAGVIGAGRVGWFATPVRWRKGRTLPHHGRPKTGPNVRPPIGCSTVPR